jgi:serine/threonine protein kinase
MSYTASTSLPPYWGLSDSVSEIAPPRLPSISLNFLAAIASSGLHHHTHATYELLRLEVRSAGTGGYATVEIGRNADNELVAVKRSKILSQPFGLRDKAAFEHHFNQLVLELRILSHERLRKHPNVTNILGLLIDDRSVHPDLSLVLEYSAFGTLDSFLGDRPTSLLVIERVDLIQQVAKGLGAVHELKICHGDVKTRNTLVFQDGEKWIAKLSDFGQSIVSGKGDFANSPLRCPFGTRLLNAPEIRKGLFVGNSLFNIDAAMSTDTFSFGLLAWEVLKNGKSFVQSSWIEDCGNDANVESMEDYLNRLPPNHLCKEALKFLEDVQMDQQVKVHLSMVFEGTLDDNPEQRIPMSRLSEMLDLSLETQE